MAIEPGENGSVIGLPLGLPVFGSSRTTWFSRATASHSEPKPNAPSLTPTPTLGE